MTLDVYRSGDLCSPHEGNGRLAADIDLALVRGRSEARRIHGSRLPLIPPHPLV